MPYTTASYELEPPPSEPTGPEIKYVFSSMFEHTVGITITAPCGTREKYCTNVPMTFTFPDYRSSSFLASATHALIYQSAPPMTVTIISDIPVKIDVFVDGVLVGSHESATTSSISGTIP